MSILTNLLHQLAPIQRVTLNSGAFSYRQAGEGPPLVLIHGWGGSSRHWLTTLHQLSRTRTIYALDLPGCGETPPLTGPTSAERLADCIVDFADTLKLGSFDLIGHSFGGAVASYVAANHPDKVQRLTLTSFGIMDAPLQRMLLDATYLPLHFSLELWHPWLVMCKPWWSFWQMWMLQAGGVPTVAWNVARPFFHHMPEDFEVIREGYNEFFMMDQLTSIENSISLGNPALRMSLPHITAPTLLISGRQDMIMQPEMVDAAAALIPDSRIAWIYGCGHVPMIERPDVYNDVVHEFLREPVPTPSVAA